MSETAPLPILADTAEAPLPEDISVTTGEGVDAHATEQEATQEETKTRAERMKQLGKTVGRAALKAAKVIGKGGKFAGEKLIVASRHTARATSIGGKFAAKKTGELARAGVNKAQEIKENHDIRVERKQQFYKEMGKVALKIANGEDVKKKDIPTPHSLRQKRGGRKRILDAMEAKERARELKSIETVYGTDDTLYSPNILKATLLKRAEIQKLKSEFDEGKIDAHTYITEKKRLKSLHHGDLFVEGGKTVTKIEKPKKVKVPEGEASSPTPSPESGESSKTETPTSALAPAPKESALERLRQMREEGSLPPVPARVEVKAKRSEEVVTATEATAPAEKEEISSTEKLAEIAYITTKDEVFRLINEENDKRTAAGKEQLTKEEKAEIWKKERAIRQSLLASLTPENRKLVNEQIGKLIEADREARKEGKEQLRDRRRREAREAEAKKRQDAKEAKRKADQAKKDREKQAAAAVARNAAQTAIDS